DPPVEDRVRDGPGELPHRRHVDPAGHLGDLGEVVGRHPRRVDLTGTTHGEAARADRAHRHQAALTRPAAGARRAVTSSTTAPGSWDTTSWPGILLPSSSCRTSTSLPASIAETLQA